MAENKDWELQNVLDEVNEIWNRLLDDIAIKTLNSDHVNSESWSQNRLQGVEVEDPT